MRPTLQTALGIADRLITEGRSCVQDLRGEVDPSKSLTELVWQIVSELQPQDAPTIHVVEQGSSRQLVPPVKEEFCQIGRECVVNALKHSMASSIEVEVNYGQTFFEMRCKDNGCGIEEHVVRTGEASGHWGLRGMRERARNVGAKLTIGSNNGRGTEILIRLRAAAAYQSGSPVAQFFSRGGRVLGLALRSSERG